MGFGNLLELCGVTLAAPPVATVDTGIDPTPWIHTDGGTAKIIRAPGRLVVAPTLSLATMSFPFGGFEIGRVKSFGFRSGGEPRLIEFEGTGDVGEILEGPLQHTADVFVRGMNSTAIRRLFGAQFETGASGHAVYSVPGSEYTGSHEWSRGVVLLFVPDDPVHVPGMILYHAVPGWDSRAALLLQRGEELGMPLHFDVCTDAQGRIATIGLIADLDL